MKLLDKLALNDHKFKNLWMAKMAKKSGLRNKAAFHLKTARASARLLNKNL